MQYLCMPLKQTSQMRRSEGACHLALGISQAIPLIHYVAVFILSASHLIISASEVSKQPSFVTLHLFPLSLPGPLGMKHLCLLAIAK